MSITNSPTWAQLEARWGHGFDTLLAQEQEAIALWWLEAETMNGRLDQYFWNSAGDQALIALRGLHALHMPVTAKAFGDALALFGPHYPSVVTRAWRCSRRLRQRTARTCSRPRRD